MFCLFWVFWDVSSHILSLPITTVGISQSQKTLPFAQRTRRRWQLPGLLEHTVYLPRDLGSCLQILFLHGHKILILV